jgi:hypothetical protein
VNTQTANINPSANVPHVQDSFLTIVSRSRSTTADADFDMESPCQLLRIGGFVLQKDRSTKEIAQQYCTPLGRKEPGSEAYRVSIAIRAED